MANVDLYEVPDTAEYAVVENALGHDVVTTQLPMVSSVGAGGSIAYYQMQANDSVTNALYTWTVTGAPDWAGASYPGPNAATNVAIIGKRVV